MDAVEQLLQQKISKKYTSCLIILFSYIALAAFIVFGPNSVTEISDLILLFLLGVIIVAVYYILTFSSIKRIAEGADIKVVNSTVVKKENVNMGIMALFGNSSLTATHNLYYTERDCIPVSAETFDSVKKGSSVFVVFDADNNPVVCYPGVYTGTKYPSKTIVPKEPPKPVYADMEKNVKKEEVQEVKEVKPTLDFTADPNINFDNNEQPKQ